MKSMLERSAGSRPEELSNIPETTTVAAKNSNEVVKTHIPQEEFIKLLDEVAECLYSHFQEHESPTEAITSSALSNPKATVVGANKMKGNRR